MMKNRGPLQSGGQPSGQGAGSVPPALVEANRRLLQGDYAGAATLFALLADRASLQRPRFAPRFTIEAGRSRMLGGEVDEGLRLMKRGLQVLYGQERWVDLQRIGMAIANSLRLADYSVQADDIQEWIRQKIGQLAPTKPISSFGHVTLPEKCPSCGGAVDPREVEWISTDTVECAFCGGLVRGKV